MSKYRVTKPTEQDYEVLLSWFNTPEELVNWAGSSIGKSMQSAQILKQLNKSDYLSRAMKFNEPNLSPNPKLAGFGQFQRVSNMLHLARLAINPAYRHRGLLKILICRLVEEAEIDTNSGMLSLFVFRKNRAAYLAYEKYGFSKVTPPIGIRLPEGCEYMVLENPKLKNMFY